LNDSNRKLSIIVLTTKLPEDIWLINSIADVCHIEGIVFPHKKRYREYNWVSILKRRTPRIGIFAVANQALLVLYRFIFEKGRDKRALQEIFNNKPTDHIEPKGIDMLEVKDINSDKVRDFIKAKKPQLVVVSGTPLLNQSIIDAAKGRVINLHPGYAPQYRGRYGSFWPIYNKEPELVGVTVHFVDAGIDTGAILVQQQVDYYTDDTLKEITYKQHKIGGDLLIKCLTQFDALAANAYHKTDCPDKNYIAPGLTHYLKAKRWLKKQNRARKLISASSEQDNNTDS
jgi:methionyl-tRNA formyltransferase